MCPYMIINADQLCDRLAIIGAGIVRGERRPSSSPSYTADSSWRPTRPSTSLPRRYGTNTAAQSAPTRTRRRASVGHRCTELGSTRPVRVEVDRDSAVASRLRRCISAALVPPGHLDRRRPLGYRDGMRTGAPVRFATDGTMSASGDPKPRIRNFAPKQPKKHKSYPAFVRHWDVRFE